MKYTFSAWVSFGKGDSGETEFEIDLTQEEFDRMEGLRNMDPDTRPFFDDCPHLSDIYEKAYKAAVAQITKEQVEAGFHEACDEDGEPWEADMLYPIGVRACWECE